MSQRRSALSLANIHDVRAVSEAMRINAESVGAAVGDQPLLLALFGDHPEAVHVWEGGPAGGHAEGIFFTASGVSLAFPLSLRKPDL